MSVCLAQGLGRPLLKEQGGESPYLPQDIDVRSV